MFWLAFVAVEVFAYVSLRKLLSPFRLFFHCADVLSWWLLRKSCTPGLPSSLSLPSEGRDGGGRSWDARVASRGFSSPPARLGPAGGVEEPLVARSVHASSLLSPRFIRGLGVQELLSCGGLLLPFCPGWLSLFISARSVRWWGGRVFGEFFSVLGCLSRLISARSARWWGFRVLLQLGFLPGLPVFGLGGREVTWARSWSDGSRVWSCCPRYRSACCARFGGQDAVSVDRLVSCFPLCSRGAIVGGLLTASGFRAFALVVSVWPVAVFWALSAPPKPLWRDR